jgi:tripartite-type tricarboxylate transporter receptor subunit TctC
MTGTPEWKSDLQKNYWTDDFMTGAQLRSNLEQSALV